MLLIFQNQKAIVHLPMFLFFKDEIPGRKIRLSAHFVNNFIIKN